MKKKDEYYFTFVLCDLKLRTFIIFFNIWKKSLWKGCPNECNEIILKFRNKYSKYRFIYSQQHDSCTRLYYIKRFNLPVSHMSGRSCHSRATCVYIFYTPIISRSTRILSRYARVFVLCTRILLKFARVCTRYCLPFSMRCRVTCVILGLTEPVRRQTTVIHRTHEYCMVEKVFSG